MKDKIIKKILMKLSRREYWGGAHTSFDNLPKGLPTHYRGDAKKLANELIKEGWLLSKPTAYGPEVSLNPKKRAEIEEFIRTH